MNWGSKRVGLALGGGGARGIAHIGVLRVFEDESIPIDILVGSSVGALVGGAYASGLGTYELEKRIEEFIVSPIFQESALKSIRDLEADKRLSLFQKIQTFFKSPLLLLQAVFKQGMLQSEDFQAMIDFFVPDVEIQDVQLPFRAVATDLLSGEAVVISKGPLRRAVMASCAVPGAVAPIVEGDKLLSDGGIACMVPTTAARDGGAEYVVAVSVTPDLPAKGEISSAMDVYVRSSNIGSLQLERRLLEEADVVIRPSVGELHWTDFALASQLVQEGEKAALGKLKDLEKGLPILERLERRWSFTNHARG